MDLNTPPQVHKGSSVDLLADMLSKESMSSTLPDTKEFKELKLKEFEFEMKNQNILIEEEPSTEEHVSKSGIVLSSHIDEEYEVCKVLSVPDDLKMTLKKGDEVLFLKRLAFPVIIQGRRYRMLAEDRVLAIAREKRSYNSKTHVV